MRHARHHVAADESLGRYVASSEGDPPAQDWPPSPPRQTQCRRVEGAVTVLAASSLHSFNPSWDDKSRQAHAPCARRERLRVDPSGLTADVRMGWTRHVGAAALATYTVVWSPEATAGIEPAIEGFGVVAHAVSARSPTYARVLFLSVLRGRGVRERLGTRRNDARGSHRGSQLNRSAAERTPPAPRVRC